MNVNDVLDRMRGQTTLLVLFEPMEDKQNHKLLQEVIDSILRNCGDVELIAHMLTGLRGTETWGQTTYMEAARTLIRVVNDLRPEPSSEEKTFNRVRMILHEGSENKALVAEYTGSMLNDACRMALDATSEGIGLLLSNTVHSLDGFIMGALHTAWRVAKAEEEAEKAEVTPA